jgi:SAM-dependent methyltransferase
MLNFTQKRIRHWDQRHRTSLRKNPFSKYYHSYLEKLYGFWIPPNQHVLELGCGTGDLLASASPSFGVGVDFSSQAIRIAKEKHPDLKFVQGDVHSLPLDYSFDVIILSDLLNDIWDAQLLFEVLKRVSKRGTRILINFDSRLWQIPLQIAESLGLKGKSLVQNWFTLHDIQNIFELTGYQVIKHAPVLLFPLNIPFLSALLNRFLVKFWPFNLFALMNFLVARPLIDNPEDQGILPSVSIVIAARNEEGNIRGIFESIPDFGADTELIFVEGHSEDQTFDKIREEISKRPETSARIVKQCGVGKADAVWLGFSLARHDILMILDADLSVPPEDLVRFYQAMVTNKGEFINGVRLVYPMESEAMQFANLAGNKLFGRAFSWLIDQPVKDTLCGTKVIKRTDFDLLKSQWPLFSKVDPFGDFDLLLGASKINLKIIDLPIRYRERTYGSTNISRWKHGLLLIRLFLRAAGYLKFHV